MRPDRVLRSGAAATPRFVPIFSWSFSSWQLSVNRRLYDPVELAAQYDKRSEVWQATLDRHGFEDAYRRLIEKVLRQSRYGQVATDLHVLDVGIGTGAMTSAFRTQLGRRFRLFGVDISRAMLAQAAARLSKLDIEPTFAQADLTELSYPDNTFDVILVAHVLEHLPNPGAALAELTRIQTGWNLDLLNHQTLISRRLHSTNMADASGRYVNCAGMVASMWFALGPRDSA